MALMRIDLVLPPDWDPTRPNNNLPMIQAVLKQRGFRNVRLIDANIRAYWYILEAGRLRRALETIKSRVKQLDRNPTLSADEAEEYYDLAQAVLSGSYVADHIAEALDVLRDWERFGNLATYGWASGVLNRAMLLAGAPWYPLSLVFDDRRFNLAHVCLGDIEKTARSGASLFAEFLREELMPVLVADAPDWLIVNLPLPSQLIPTLTLARLVKEVLPRTHITISGMFVNYNELAISRWPGLFDFVDTVIPGIRQFSGASAEAPLIANLGEALAVGRDLAGVPGVMFRDAHTGQIRCAEYEREMVHIGDLPTPDFDGLAREKYFSPVTIWPLTLSKGCYWGKCTYCTRLDPYEERSAAQVVDDMKRLTVRHGAKYFYLPDDGIRPELYQALSARLIEENVEAYWFSMAHPNKKLTEETCRMMHRAGCRLLEFGIESAAPRVLKIMQKGTSAELVQTVLRNCHVAGINAHAYIIAGFPTETDEEARLTLDFILNNRRLLNSVRPIRFILEPQSIIASKPEAFGITRAAIGTNRELAMNMYYDVAQGAGMKEAIEIWARAHEALNEAYKNNVMYHIFRTHAFLLTAIHGRCFLDSAITQACAGAESDHILDSSFEAAFAIEEKGSVLRYRLQDIKERKIEWLIDRELRKKREILDHCDGQAITPGSEIRPAPKPVRYVYAGSTDTLCEVTDSILKFIAMLRPDRMLGELARERGINDVPRVGAVAQSLWRMGLLRRRESWAQ